MELSAEQKAALEEQKKSCIFCRIVAGDAPSKKVFEDDLVLAVLDISPACKGHILVLPKEHYPIMPLIPQKTFEHLFLRVKDLSYCTKQGLLCDGTTVFIANGGAAGQQSQHFLLHLIPRDKGDSLDKLDIPRHDLPPDEIERLSKAIASNLPLIIKNHYQRTGQKYPGKIRIPKEKLIGIIEANPPLLDAVLKQPEEFKKLVPNHPQLKDLFADQDIDAILAEIFLKRGKPYPPTRPAARPAPDEPIEAEFEEAKEEKETSKEKTREQKRKNKEAREDDDGSVSEEDVFAALGGIANKGNNDSNEKIKNESEESSEDSGEDTDKTDTDEDAVDLDDIARLFK